MLVYLALLDASLAKDEIDEMVIKVLNAVNKADLQGSHILVIFSCSIVQVFMRA